MMVLIELPEFSLLEGFEWDTGNRNKNRFKHHVTIKECEQLFFNRSIIIFQDEKHSSIELRFGVLGTTNEGRLLALVFTIRNNKVRVISARAQSRKERRLYEQESASEFKN